MMQLKHDNPRHAAQDYPQLVALLSRVADAQRKQRRRARMRTALAWWLMLLLALMIVDVLWPAQTAGRFAVLLVLIVAGGLLLIAAWRGRPWFGHAAEKSEHEAQRESTTAEAALLHAAGDLEQQHGLDDNPLVNALWLGKHHAASQQEQSDLVAALEQRCLSRGLSVAGQTDHRAIAAGSNGAPGQWITPGRLLGLTLGLWLAVGVLVPRLPAAQLPRMALPAGDHPVFSLTRLEVTLPVQPVMEGRDVPVHVTYAGQAPGSLNVEVLDDQGQVASRLPMMQTGPRSFDAVLTGLSDDVRIRVADEQSHARTRAMQLHVEPWQSSLRADASSTQSLPADQQGQREEAQPAESAVDAAERDKASSASAASGSDMTIQQAIERMARQASTIAQNAQAMADDIEAETAKRLAQQDEGATQGNDASKENWRERPDVKALESEIQAFKQQAAALKKMAQQPSDDSNQAAPSQAQMARLQQLASMLDTLDLPSQPTPGQLEKPDTPSQLQCVNGICNAAKADVRKLTHFARQASPGPGESDDPAGYLSQQDETDPARLPGDDSQGLRQGGYDMTGQTATGELLRTEARMKEVPEIYRGKAADYFDRINEQPAR